MKTVLVDPEIVAPGTTDALIEPEDLLSEEEDPVVFVDNEPLLVRFVDSLYVASGFVRKIHEDEYGQLIQVAVDWEGAHLPDNE